MMKILLATIAVSVVATASAVTDEPLSNTVPADTSKVVDIEEVVVVASPKENYKLRQQPLSAALFSSNELNGLGVTSVKHLSAYAPNLFMPDYGSRLTSAMYIRGVGARINTPAVGLYVDNMPMPDKSAFDFFMLDAERVDVLNGPQSTLYGQNAMGGIIRFFTADPMRRQGTTVSIGATGRTTGRRISAVTRQKLSDKLALSVGGYLTSENGFFRNDSTGKKADGINEAGARVRAVFRPVERLNLDMQVNYNYTDQDAYPYYYTGKTADATGEEQYADYVDRITANRQGKYRRGVLTAGLNAGYEFNTGTLSAVTTYQFLQDRMFMDQDFIAADIYSLEQKQRNQSISEDISYKTVGNSRWQSVSGLYFMHENRHVDCPVNFYSDGMAYLNSQIANVLPTVTYENPYTHTPVSATMSLALTDPGMEFNGRYVTPSTTYDVYHQSTFRDIIIPRLSLVAGLCLNIDHQSLDYKVNSGNVNYQFATSMSRPADLVCAPAVSGKRKDDYVQLLPKLALQYDLPENQGNVYLSFSKGYRSGGYNIEMCSELAQTQLEGDMMRGVKQNLDDTFQQLIDNARNETLRNMFSGIKENIDNNIPSDVNAPGAKTLRYKPEYSFNYELGTHLNLLEHALQVDAAVFFMTTHDQQIARFSAHGLGRQMVNAGRSDCCGAELSVRSSLLDGNLNLAATYGFTHSEFRKYNDGKNDYKGNYVPFVPMHNMSAAANYTFQLKGGTLRAIEVGANVTGAGRIYWTENNKSWQNFYANLGAHVLADMGLVKLNVWGKNLTCCEYDTFYFESMNRGYEQHGLPCHFGADLTFEF